MEQISAPNNVFDFDHYFNDRSADVGQSTASTRCRSASQNADVLALRHFQPVVLHGEIIFERILAQQLEAPQGSALAGPAYRLSFDLRSVETALLIAPKGFHLCSVPIRGSSVGDYGAWKALFCRAVRHQPNVPLLIEIMLSGGEDPVELLRFSQLCHQYKLGIVLSSPTADISPRHILAMRPAFVFLAPLYLTLAQKNIETPSISPLAHQARLINALGGGECAIIEGIDSETQYELATAAGVHLQIGLYWGTPAVTRRSTLHIGR